MEDGPHALGSLGVSDLNNYECNTDQRLDSLAVADLSGPQQNSKHPERQISGAVRVNHDAPGYACPGTFSRRGRYALGGLRASAVVRRAASTASANASQRPRQTLC